MSKKGMLIAATMCSVFAIGTALAADKDHPVKDAMITTKVKAELAKDSNTKAHKIHVTTKDGVVMLSGTVATAGEKEKAEADAKMVKGVVDVRNKIDVK
jgi:hyperosmotically inducible protein